MRVGLRCADGCEQGLVHSAVFYRSQREYLDCVVPLLMEWSSSAEPVLVALAGDKTALLREALGSAVGEIAFTDITELGRNPGRILGLIGGFLQQHPSRPARIVSEAVWPGRSAIEYLACVHHEALFNLAFAGQQVTGLCLYNSALLASPVLDDAWITHPMIWRAGSQESSPRYAVDVALERCNTPLCTGSAAVTYTVAGSADLSNARKCGARYGRLLGLSEDRLTDLRLIVTELATNSLLNGGGTCQLAFWHHNGHLICEARDGERLADPLAGRRPPGIDGSGASELFVVNAVADLVRIHTALSGTTIHAYLRLDRAFVK